MKDDFGREIKVGDIIAKASGGSKGCGYMQYDRILEIGTHPAGQEYYVTIPMAYENNIRLNYKGDKLLYASGKQIRTHGIILVTDIYNVS